MSKSYAKYIRIGNCCGSNTDYYRARRRLFRKKYAENISKAFQKAESASEPDFISMVATAYQYGTTRFDGGKVRTGICAAKPEWYGKVAAVYEDDCGAPGEFIGYFV